MKTMSYNGLLGLIVMIMVIAFTISGCKKNDSETEPEIESDTSFGGLHFKSNPYSLINVKLALVELGRSDEKLDEERIYNYYKFDPKKFTGDMMKVLSEDSTNQMMEVPFASPNFYSDQVVDNWETEQESLKDGNLYIVFKANSKLNSIFQDASGLGATKLDELYLPESEDTSLQLQTTAIAANTTVPELRLRFCFFKRPHGTIRYKDTETGALRGVPQIRVWALVFGIPVYDETDNNGYYNIPWRFSVGTLMGIHAQNSRMKIIPLNTTGSFLSAVGQIITNFILGSRKDFGWYSSCKMKKNINKDYTIHNQERLWCHILHGVKLHHGYAAQDGIQSAPSGLTCYAQWANSSGAASTPMLKNIAASPASLLLSIMNALLGTNLSATAPQLFNLMLGKLPDMTFKYSATESHFGYHTPGSSNSRFSETVMNTIFHELSHASLYRKVGNSYWLSVIWYTVQNNGYGNGTATNWGRVQVNEAWAEFYGNMQHFRHHPSGHANVTWLGNPYNNTWANYPAALENAPWFNQPWINTGIFYDLYDDNNAETNDQLGGYSISDMYNTYSSKTNSFCDWRANFITRNPGINVVKLDKLMINQNLWNSAGCRRD